MMKIKIAVVGKIKEKYFADACNEYIKRLSRFASVSVVEVKEENFTSEPSQAEALSIIKKEGASLLKELKGSVYVMAIEGKKYSSETFANLIKTVKDGSGEMTIVIGGSHGVDKDIKNKADGLISMSDMTFPHTLARVMLLEQIYRGFMILSNSRYHK